MATVNIEHNKVTNVTAKATFNEIIISLKNLKSIMKVTFNGERETGFVDLLDIYNSFTAAEKLIIIKFVKMQAVGCFNDAMGSNYKWEQVPDTIFGEGERDD